MVQELLHKPEESVNIVVRVYTTDKSKMYKNMNKTNTHQLQGSGYFWREGRKKN